MKPKTNIELKARCADLSAAVERARALGAQPAGEMRQIDTYFHTPQDRRLKLREIDGTRAELIAYRRPDEPGFRASEYHVVPVGDPAALKSALADTLGIRIRVEKRRQLLLWDNVRIHLDRVDGLGDFIEFEAVLSAADDEAASRRKLAELCAALRIEDADRIAGSYGDLVEKK